MPFRRRLSIITNDVCEVNFNDESEFSTVCIIFNTIYLCCTPFGHILDRPGQPTFVTLDDADDTPRSMMGTPEDPSAPPSREIASGSRGIGF